MIQETFNAEKRSTIRKKHGTEISRDRNTGTGELHDTPMKLRPVLTNMFIALLVMALLAVCFRF